MKLEAKKYHVENDVREIHNVLKGLLRTIHNIEYEVIKPDITSLEARIHEIDVSIEKLKCDIGHFLK